MSPLWKIVIALMVVLPVGGYVVGSLIASGAAEPDDRDTIVIDGTGSDTGSTPSEGPSRDARTDDPTAVTPRPEAATDDDDTDDEDDDDTYAGGGAAGGTGGPAVQTRTREVRPPRDGGQSTPAAPAAPSGQGGQSGQSDDDRTRDDDDDRTRDADDNDDDDRDDDQDDD